MILFFKLLEIFQFVVLAFYLSLFITDYYNDVLYKQLYKIFENPVYKLNIHLFVIIYLRMF